VRNEAKTPNPSFERTCAKSRAGRSIQTLGLVLLSVVVPFSALPPPSFLRVRPSHSRHDPLFRSPLLGSPFSLSMLLRYALVTMSRAARSSFFLFREAPAAVTSTPSALAVGAPLPLASPSVGSSAGCHRSGQVGGSYRQVSSHNVNASESGWRRLSFLAVARSLRSAQALCACLVSHGSFARSVTAARPNHWVNRTPGKLRLPVPSALRAPVAGYLKR
jgi:hypothetical protein